MPRRDPFSTFLEDAARDVWSAIKPVFLPKKSDAVQPAGYPLAYVIRRGFMVAESDVGSAQAVAAYCAAGGTAPLEITMVAQLAARYGAQVAMPSEPAEHHSIFILIPRETPTVVGKIAEAAGYHRVAAPDDRPYEPFEWTS